MDWERNYKWEAHLEWEAALSQKAMDDLITVGRWQELAARAVRIESGRSLLFSFEKMALRDAVKSEKGAEIFAQNLFRFLYGRGSLEERFVDWVAAVARLPRRQTRVLTWPLVTVFGFIA